MAFATSARTISDRREGRPPGGTGSRSATRAAAYARRVSRPCRRPPHRDPDRRSYTERVPEPDPGSPRSGELRVLRRARTGLRLDREGEARPLLTRAQEPRRGLDLRPRPVAARARADRGARRAAASSAPRPSRPRLRRSGLGAGRPPLRRSRAGDHGSPLEIVPVARSRFWREVAAWIPELRALVVADALGTVGYFRAPGERLGVHPLLRFRPPKTLGRYEPRHILCGHGTGIIGGCAQALQEALRTARRRLRPGSVPSGRAS